MAIMDKILLPLRAVQIFCAIVVLGLAAHIVNDINHYFGGFGDGYTWSQGDYNIFVAVWTILVCIALIAVPFVMKDGGAMVNIAVLVLDGLSWIFWLAAFACVASFINGYTGSSEFNALVAFGVIEWILFSVTLALAVLGFMRGGVKT